MKFDYGLLAEMIPGAPSLERAAECITNHLLEVESAKDGILDVKILPNRYSDAACYRGLAREITAALALSYKEPAYTVPKRSHTRKTAVAIEVPYLCRRLMACRVEGIKAKATPAWMRRALEVYGIRPISPIVDITNYITIETGQPLHAFDADRVAGTGITARQAHAGEAVTTLDGVEVDLNPSIVVLADAEGALDIAGIKGGRRGEITSTTSNIILTAGNFDGTLIYKTARRIGITTDASLRFSHHIAPALAAHGMFRALKLILEITGGEIGPVTDIYPKPVKQGSILFSLKRFTALTGIDITEAECIRILKRLGFDCKGKKITPPPERTDITRFEDIVEEIVRMRGYSAVPAIPPRLAVVAATPDPMRRLKDRVHEALMSFGFSEIITHSFAPEGEVALENPLSPEQAFLRADLKWTLSRAISRNIKAFDTVRLFEIGSVFHKKNNHEPAEEIACCFGMLAREIKKEDLWRIMRGSAESLLERLDIHNFSFIEEKGTLSVRVGSEPVGIIAHMDEGGVYAEFSLAKLLGRSNETRQAVPLPKYPSIARDVSFLVDSSMKAGTLMEVAKSDTPATLIETRFISAYEGKGIPEGKKSITVRFIFQSSDRTLTDQEADEVLGYIKDAMAERISFEIK
jgi:phenylalanyl-tRNA synthetase beta chain